ncbi:MAG: efflux RND transporter permease subunit [Planctomycetes bacterium]|nr:efflux RND transporter permease subunit [Planctomycetota bacterium]
MGLIRFAIENPVKVTVGVILLVLSGLLSLTRMRVQLTPDVDRPIITVTTRWIGASPQEIEREIVERQEEKLKNVSGLQKIRSECTRNQAKIELEFPVGIDKDTAFRDVSDKLRQVSGYPEEVDEPTISASSDSMELTIAWMILYSKEGMDVSRLKTFIEDHVKPILERAEGISEVPVYGGRDREVQVVLDAHRLAARRLTFRDVEKALRQQNESSSAGTIAMGKRDYSYRTIGEYVTLGDIEDTVIAYDDGGPVLVRDVASVVQGFKKPVSFVRSKGRPVMALPARRETNANVIKAMTNLKRQIQLVNREILQPRGLSLELTQVYDETTYIWSAIYLVVKNIAVGGFLAVLVLLLFLRSGSATVIIAATIPVSVIGTFLVITMVGRSLNVVLLAGMAFAVGMVVDNAIVVLENIYRHRAMGKSKVEAALDGTREVWGAILASTLTTMAVFLPMITIQEEAGQLFKDIAVAIATAVGLSLLVSILVIPPLASRFFSASSAQRTGDKPWRIAAWVSSRVTAINRRVGRRVAVVAGVSGAALVGSYALMPATEYLTAGNKNLVFGFLFSPPGYSIDEFRRMAHIIEDGDPDDPLDGLRPFWEAELGSPEAAALPPVEIQVGKDGRITRMVQPPPIENFFFVSFSGGSFMGCTSKEPTNVKPLEQVMTRASSRIPGVFTMFNQSSLFRTGGRRGGNTIDMEIRSASLEKVVAAASAIQRRIQKAGYGWASSTPENFALGRPELRLIPDRAKAADLGLDVRDLGFILQACIDGAFVGEFNDHGDRIDLVLKVADTEEATVDEIGGIPTEQGGEIKFVDPDVTPAGGNIDNQIILLRKRIKDEVLRFEIEKRAIDPPDAAVIREVNAYAEQQWRLLFPNEVKKKEVLSRMQLTGLKILQGLTIWKQDTKKGNDFAKLELEPLGMNERAWAFYTNHVDDPEILQKLKKWEDVDNMSRDDIKEFLFSTKNEDHKKNIRFMLEKDMLRRTVVPEVFVSEAEAHRLFELINKTEWIDIIIIPENDKEFGRLNGTPKKDRQKALSEELTLRKQRLQRFDIKDDGRDIAAINEFMIIAAYTESLEPGTLSSVIKWPGQNGKSRNFVIYIVEKQSKNPSSDPRGPELAELSKALRKFKRNQAFEHWLNTEITLRTKILIPKYREAVRN